MTLGSSSSGTVTLTRSSSLYVHSCSSPNKLLISLKAGLFSAILSAFLIESRKALHEDPQDLTNLLLTTVTQELRNATPASTCTNCFRPETFQIAVNYLWFLGLTFSVGSAFLAVLAKGWVSLYNVSPDNQHWSHAHSRQLRYNNMVVWKLVTVISCIPLFLHISVFFFFAGLVTLLIYDSYEIAYSNLAIIFIMTMFYVFMTILPVLFPGCPFKTPFSVQMFPARAVTPGKHTTFWGFISVRTSTSYLTLPPCNSLAI